MKFKKNTKIKLKIKILNYKNKEKTKAHQKDNCYMILNLFNKLKNKMNLL